MNTSQVIREVFASIKELRNELWKRRNNSIICFPISTYVIIKPNCSFSNSKKEWRIHLTATRSSNSQHSSLTVSLLRYCILSTSQSLFSPASLLSCALSLVPVKITAANKEISESQWIKIEIAMLYCMRVIVHMFAFMFFSVWLYKTTRACTHNEYITVEVQYLSLISDENMLTVSLWSH